MKKSIGWIAAGIWKDSGNIFWYSRITTEHQAKVTANIWRNEGQEFPGIKIVFKEVFCEV